MTLSDIQGHFPIAILFKYDFSYSWAAVAKISTDSASRVPSAIAELLVCSRYIAIVDDHINDTRQRNLSLGLCTQQKR